MQLISTFVFAPYTQAFCELKTVKEPDVLMGRHYKNTPMQYTAIFHSCMNVNFQMKIFSVFLIFAQNIDCGYTLEPPQ